MNSDHGDPSDNNAPLPSEFANNQGEDLKDNILRRAGWLRGFRTDGIDEPQISAHQVASCVDGTAPFIEELGNVSTDIILTNTEREASFVHHGWSIDATRTVSPWTLSRIARKNHPDDKGTWFTKLTKSKRLKVQVLLEDLTPVPEFEAAVEGALGQPTLFEKFQAIYRVLDHWGDVVPLEIEIGSSIAITAENMDSVQPSGICGPNYGSIARLLTTKDSMVTITGTNLGLNYGQWIAIDGQDPQAQRIVVRKVALTVSLLASNLQAQLSELYAQRVTYFPPYGIGRIRHCHRTYDDNKHTLKTISSVTVRSSDFIELLSITYSDGTTSSSHGGGGHVGVEYKFTLAADEYITEMLTWVDDDWLFGLQFVTSTGRCSPQYGAHRDLPTVARSKGGVLVGFLSHTKQHPEYKEMFSGVQGIWRHDVLPKVPKEEDVYSEYFGDKNSSWDDNVFNDRMLVGNSKSIYISSVQVWSGDSIDGIQFIYNDHKDGQEIKSMSSRHGGSDGTLQQFVLTDAEHIVTVSGRHGEQRITQLCFGTNRGRTSEIYGGGKGKSFSASAPRDQNGNPYRLQYICGKK